MMNVCGLYSYFVCNREKKIGENMHSSTFTHSFNGIVQLLSTKYVIKCAIDGHFYTSINGKIKT